jgi:HEAT repeat protein
MTPDRLNQLEQQLRSQALNERKAALDELAKTDSNLAVPILQRLAAESDFLYRRFGVMGLGNHPTPESLATLKQLLEQEKDANVLAEIANSLFEFGDQALPLLPELFARSDHWLLRQTIMGILVDADRPEILFNVLELGLQDTDVTTKEAAILALGTLVNQTGWGDRVMPLLLELAKSERWRDRWRAATTLSIAADDRAKVALMKLQQDENHYVVAAALEAGIK